MRDLLNAAPFYEAIERDKYNFQRLWSSMDQLDDTSYAIRAYEKHDPVDHQMLYLMIYGLLQAMQVQNDCLAEIARVLKPHIGPSMRPDKHPAIKRTNTIRSRIAGHPSTSKGIDDSYGIVQADMTKESVRIYHFDPANWTPQDINITELILDQRAAFRAQLECLLRAIRGTPQLTVQPD